MKYMDGWEIIYENGLDWDEGDYITIWETKKIINRLEENGCTHLSIIHHEDHGTHIFSGVKIYQPSLKEELRLNLELIKTISDKKNLKILELEEEIKNLKNEIN